MLIHGWKRGLLIGEKPSKSTGSGGRSRQDEASQVLLEVYGGTDSANGVTVIDQLINPSLKYCKKVTHIAI